VATDIAATFGLREGERLARRDPKLPLHESRPVTSSVTGLLHLEARVHLQEEELAVLVEELDGPRVHVAARPRRDRRLAHRLAQLGGEAIAGLSS